MAADGRDVLTELGVLLQEEEPGEKLYKLLEALPERELVELSWRLISRPGKKWEQALVRLALVLLNITRTPILSLLTRWRERGGPLSDEGRIRGQKYVIPHRELALAAYALGKDVSLLRERCLDGGPLAWAIERALGTGQDDDVKIAVGLILSNRHLIPDENFESQTFSFWDEVRRAESARTLVSSNSETLPLHKKASTGDDFVRVEGVMLPFSAPTLTVSDSFVVTEALRKPLRQAAEAIAGCHPLLIEGPEACGKAALISHLANKSGQAPVRVHLDLLSRQTGAQHDIPGLIGSLAPVGGGCFQWQAGPIGTALEQGRWLLLTGLKQEKNTPEVTSLVGRLAALRPGGSDVLTVPGTSHEVSVAAGYRVLITVSGEQSSRCGWKETFRAVHMEAPARAELVSIFKGSFPLVSDCADRVADSLAAIGVLPMDFSRTSISDGLKVMARLDALHRRSIDRRHLTAESAAWEAYIVLAGGEPDPTIARKAVTALSEVWSTSGSLLEMLLTKGKPVVNEHEQRIEVGRALLTPLTNPSNSRTDMAKTSAFLRVLESTARSVEMGEHILLSGETGTGKTSTLQSLAGLVGKQLTVVNMSQQTDATHLIGGFRPVELSREIQSLASQFEEAFKITLSKNKNQLFLNSLRQAVVFRDANRSLSLMRGLVNSLPTGKKTKHVDRRRLWADVEFRLGRLEAKVEQLVQTDLSDASAQRLPKRERRSAVTQIDFEFFPGPLTHAVMSGGWILLDELNLAPDELLEQLASVLRDKRLFIHENGTEIRMHPDFLLFGAMNPPTDFGKKPLPGSLRRLFSELYVSDHFDKTDITTIAGFRFYGTAVSQTGTEANLMTKVAHIYDSLRCMQLSDGTEAAFRPSLRHLSVLIDHAAGLRRHVQSFSHNNRLLFEGSMVGLVSSLNSRSKSSVSSFLAREFGVPEKRKPLAQLMKIEHQKQCENVEGYLIQRGPGGLEASSDFVITPSAKLVLTSIARSLALGSRRTPILLQGPTAAGKTALVRFLAVKTGHKLIRINNHEHTDVSEYLGFYVSTEDGSLVFHEGPLVRAAREGHWVVLDELNLAPPDVLESLNRLLDDNREIRVPETGAIVKAHPSFALFATQNPPKLYGGRKELSRALRGRFIELSVPELGDKDLVTILKSKYRLPDSFAVAMTKVAKELERRRQLSNFFRGKEGFLTPRDLFRWASREPRSREELAMNGFYLLGDRARSKDEREIVREVLSLHTGADPSCLRDANLYSAPSLAMHGLVATPATSRVLTLLLAAVKRQEPVLLVGPTGSGKTTACQSVASYLGSSFTAVNLHRNSEASDFVGSYRPAYKSTDKLFEWVHGPLTRAMLDGSALLLDELNMADDAVLERLNSVLEEDRRLCLVEKGSSASRDAQEIVANTSFRIFATMNPGGDYGKRELSPALRNRFTEVWVPAPRGIEDFAPLLELQLPKLPQIRDRIGLFCARSSSLGLDMSLRDAYSWAEFVRVAVDLGTLTVYEAYMHGADITFLDTLRSQAPDQLSAVMPPLLEAVPQGNQIPVLKTLQHDTVKISDGSVDFGPFRVSGQKNFANLSTKFNFSAPQTSRNLVRIARALLLPRPILLEGPPGVGKTAVAGIMAQLAGYRFIRINLSEHTEMGDLLGTEAPTATPGKFKFQHGLLLRAIIDGSWVLLDELNLATQSVLEGLNSLLDHRREVWVPELGQNFRAPAHFQIFGAQNPAAAGGGRKSLPGSFLNRFSRVFIADLDPVDVHAILTTRHPLLSDRIISLVVETVTLVNKNVNIQRQLNLRDAERWCLLVSLSHGTNVMTFYKILVAQAIPAKARLPAEELLWAIEGRLTLGPELTSQPASVRVTRNHVSWGKLTIERGEWCQAGTTLKEILADDHQDSFAAMICAVAIGDAFVMQECSSLVQQFAACTGKYLVEIELSGSADSIDILGGYENFSAETLRAKVRHQIRVLLEAEVSRCSQTGDLGMVQQLLSCSLDREGLDSFTALTGRAPPDDLLETIRMLDVLKDSKTSSFVWRRSKLLHAIENDQWVLLRNANLCSPAVLDRLNPFLERNRDPVVIAEAPSAEDGNPVVVNPSKDFRLFISLDPTGPTLSQAILNRSITVHGVTSSSSKPTERDLRDVTAALKVEKIYGETELKVAQLSSRFGPETYLLSANSDDLQDRIRRVRGAEFHHLLENEIVLGPQPMGAELLGWGLGCGQGAPATQTSGIPYDVLVLRKLKSTARRLQGETGGVASVLSNLIDLLLNCLQHWKSEDFCFERQNFIRLMNAADFFSFCGESLSLSSPLDERILAILVRLTKEEIWKIEGQQKGSLVKVNDEINGVLTALKFGSLRSGLPFPRKIEALRIEKEILRALCTRKFDSLVQKVSLFQAAATLTSKKSLPLLRTFETLLSSSNQQDTEQSHGIYSDLCDVVMWNFCVACLDRPTRSDPKDIACGGQRLIDDFLPLELSDETVLSLISLQGATWSLVHNNVEQQGHLKELFGRCVGTRIATENSGFCSFARVWRRSEDQELIPLANVAKYLENPAEATIMKISTVGSRHKVPSVQSLVNATLSDMEAMFKTNGRSTSTWVSLDVDHPRELIKATSSLKEVISATRESDLQVAGWIESSIKIVDILLDNWLALADLDPVDLSIREQQIYQLLQEMSNDRRKALCLLEEIGIGNIKGSALRSNSEHLISKFEALREDAMDNQAPRDISAASFQDLRHLVDTLRSGALSQNTIRKIRQAANNSSRESHKTFRTWDLTVKGLVDKLQPLTPFGHLRDVWGPVRSALQLCRLAISIERQARSQTEEEASMSFVIEMLTDFTGNGILDSEWLLRLEENHVTRLHQRTIAATVMKRLGSFDVADTVKKTSIFNCMEILVRGWQKKLEKEDRAAELSASVFVQKTNSLDDPEDEDEDFAKLFNLRSQANDETSKVKQDKVFSDLEIWEMFESSSPLVVNDSLQVALGTVDDLLQATPEHFVLSPRLEQHSFPLYALAALNGLRTGRNSLDGYYMSAHLCQKDALRKVLEDFVSQARTVQHNPDLSDPHPVLQRAIDAASFALRLSADSPLGLFASHVEVIIQRIEEWDHRYATKDMKMLSSRSKLQGLVAEWRQRELESWPVLFAQRVARPQHRAGTWFVHLYNMIVRRHKGSLGDDLRAALEEFLRNSSIGEFKTRVKITRKIADFLSHCFPSDVDNSIWGLLDFYDQFSDAVDEAHKAAVSALEKKLKDLMKLLTWKKDPDDREDMTADEEYYRVKTFGDRNKRKFHALCRELDQALSLSVQKVLESEASRDHFRSLERLGPVAPEQIFVAASPSQNDSKTSQAEQVPQVALLLKHMKGTGHLVASKNMTLVATESIQLLRTSMVNRMKELSVLEERGVSARKRGLVDLFRALKSLGVGMTQSTTTDGSLESHVWLRSPRFCNSAANLLFFESAFGVQRLRQNILEAHADLNERECALMRNSSKSLFHLTVDERYHISETYNIIQEIDTISTSLKMWSGGCFPTPLDLTSRKENSAKFLASLRCLAQNAENLCDAMAYAITAKAEAIAEHETLRGRNVLSQNHSDVMRILQLVQEFLGAQLPEMHKTRELQTPVEKNAAILEATFEESVRSLRKRLEEMKTLFVSHTQKSFTFVNDHQTLSLSVKGSLLVLMNKYLDSRNARQHSAALNDSVQGSAVDLVFDSLAKLQATLTLSSKECEESFSFSEEKISAKEAKPFRGAREAHKMLRSSILPPVLICAQKTVGAIHSVDAANATLSDPLKDQIERATKSVAYLLNGFVHSLVGPLLNQIVVLHREKCHLSRNVTKVFSNIIQSGFCGPKEDAGENDGEGQGTEVDGVGMAEVGDGDTSGAKDVTGEIEEDEQLEGLQNDALEKNDPDSRPGDSSGKEMKEDFEAELRELESESSESDGEVSDKEENDSLEEEFEDTSGAQGEETMEKMCDDDDEEDSIGEGDEEVGIPDGATNVDELAANEGEKGDELPASGEEAKEDAAEDKIDDNDEGSQTSDDDNASVSTGDDAKRDSQLMQSVKMDNDSTSDPGQDEPDEALSDGNEISEAESDEQASEGENEGRAESDAAEDMDIDDANVDAEHADATVEESEPHRDPLTFPTTQQPDGPAHGEDHAGANGTPGDLEARNPSEGLQFEEGVTTENKELVGRTQDAIDHVDDAAGEPRQSMNPSQRSPADLAEAWIQRLQLVQEVSRGEREDEKLTEASREGLFELSKEPVDGVDARHLGSMENEPLQVDEFADLDEQVNKTKDHRTKSTLDSDEKSSGSTPETPHQGTRNAPSHREAEAGADQTNTNDKQEDSRISKETRNDKKKNDDFAIPRPDQKNTDKKEDDIQTPDIRSPAEPENANSQMAWSQIVATIFDGAADLCQQLHLVLEPTVRSRLAGDFKTGKRLNMRRVVEFVASDYRKDRIWLRRVRPDKRNYDVLIAIDDSESMADSGAGVLALEAMCLIHTALARLEVGRVGVLRFGESAEEIHGLDDGPITEAKGDELVSKFSFGQSKTELVPALAFAGSVLDSARRTSTSSELSQIVFFISDGRITEREKIRELVRKSLERRQVIAFILIDGQSPRASDRETESSILDMKRVEYEDGSVKIVPYIDDFPFPFYVIVQQVERIPEVVGEAMRQWFEEVHSQNR